MGCCCCFFFFWPKLSRQNCNVWKQLLHNVTQENGSVPYWLQSAFYFSFQTVFNFYAKWFFSSIQAYAIDLKKKIESMQIIQKKIKNCFTLVFGYLLPSEICLQCLNLLNWNICNTCVYFCMKTGFGYKEDNKGKTHFHMIVLG